MKKFFGAVFGILLCIFFSTHASAATSNSITNPSVETVSGSSPTAWLTSSWGGHSANFSVVTPGQDGSRALRIDMASYVGGQADWYFAPVAVTANTQYDYSEYYQSNVPTEVVAELYDGTGAFTQILLGRLDPTAEWKQFSGSFTTAANTQSVTVFHLIKQNGWVQTDNFSLSLRDTTPTPTPTPTPGPTPTPTPTPSPTPTPTPVTNFNRAIVSIDFDDGWTSISSNAMPVVNKYGFKTTQYIISNYLDDPSTWFMSTVKLRQMLNSGHVLGSHTTTHPHLPTLTNKQVTNQLANSKTKLDRIYKSYNKKVTMFATPYCETSATVVSVAKLHYQAVRNCDGVTNTRANFDRWNLKSKIVTNTTTTETITQWVTEAIAEKSWLILVYHEVAEPAQVKGGELTYSITPAELDKHMQAIKNSGAAVLTSDVALAEVLAQL